MIDTLRRAAMEHPDAVAITFLPSGESAEGCLTFQMLDLRARALAAKLQSLAPAGERALLLYPSSLEFVEAFLACLYAGIVAIPAYAPRVGRTLLKLKAIAADSQPALVLTTKAVLDRAGAAREEMGLEGVCWETTDEIGVEWAQDWKAPVLHPDSLAFLQYTSGSTALPKGVMVSHGNLLSNHRMIRYALCQSEKAVIVSWMPLFHDMGLIGNALHAFLLGAHCVLMPPEAFLMKPVRWLQAIARYRGTQSGGPNFAYELCARRVTEEQRVTLDLSSWKDAFVGAEPVRAATLKRFSTAFSSCGFLSSAFYPCYGLAEATLFVTGGDKNEGARAAVFDSKALEEHRAIEAAKDAARTRPLVSCGKPKLEGEVVIVDPETGRECEANTVGEIWAGGPQVALGYWKQPEATAQTFRATVATRPGKTFLRTGDLGFFHEGDLFIAGRLKDHIVIAGRNHHPHDIELTIERAHPAIRSGCCAAFPVDVEDSERLVVAAELERSFRGPDAKDIAQSVRRAVAEEHDLMPYAVALLKPAACPRTTSGKIMRQACRAGFLAGTLDLWEAPQHTQTK